MDQDLERERTNAQQSEGGGSCVGGSTGGQQSSGGGGGRWRTSEPPGGSWHRGRNGAPLYPWWHGVHGSEKGPPAQISLAPRDSGPLHERLRPLALLGAPGVDCQALTGCGTALGDPGRGGQPEALKATPRRPAFHWRTRAEDASGPTQELLKNSAVGESSGFVFLLYPLGGKNSVDFLPCDPYLRVRGHQKEHGRSATAAAR